jgi:phosphotransacetylase
VANVRSRNGDNEQCDVKKQKIMIVVGIKKPRIFEQTKHFTMKEIADKVSIDDQNEIDNLLKKIRKDARGRFMYNKKDALAILPFFNKYIDAKVGKNIFGCGGCVNKIMNKMFELQKEWRNLTK